MSSWAERVHRRAADIGNVVTSCGHPSPASNTYPYRLEKVKFGVALEEVCKSNNNIPGPLLVLILKLNKESPNRRDVFRAPGHQGAMKKLIHFLQAGRLVNVDNYSVYTIASVLKKFLRKIPNGIFGRAGEQELFAINEVDQEAEQSERLHRLFTSLPKYTQHLLVLLFGTFRVIASNAAHACTGMTSEALGVSVAPSFFQTCVSDGKNARMEDVLKFKVATRIMKHIIDKFATHDLFGRENYEYYARVTGRILKVQDEWICSFQYPPPPRGKLAQQKYALQHSLEAEKTWLQCQCERWGLLAQEESRSTPALLTSSSSALDNSALSLGVTPEHSFIESCARLSVSLEGPGLFALTSSPIPKRGNEDERGDVLDLDNDDDENDVADDEDDDDDDGGAAAANDIEGDLNRYDEHDIAAGLEVSNDDDIENNPKRHVLRNKCLRNNVSRPFVGGNRIMNAEGGGDDDDDDDEVTVVKRRYRQNKKKTNLTPTVTRAQQQRWLRSTTASKSLEHAQIGSELPISLSAPPPTPPKPAHLQKMSAATAAAVAERAKAAGAIAANGAAIVPRSANNATKTRNCSRCKHGNRHSSSCSSASGGGSGSHMTLEELRAVNRYAESTKSLSYLPQVHERQTARMRTRSEWFLGPEDHVDNSLLLLQTTCSNCCLAAERQQQHQHQHHHHHFYQQQQQQQFNHLQQRAATYLGGGSAGNMLLQRDDTAVSDDMCLLRMKRLKQQQQQQQQKYFHQAEYMDTEESHTNDYDRENQPRQQQQQQQQHLRHLHLHSTAADDNGDQCRLHLESAAAAAEYATPAAPGSTAAAATTTNIVGNIRLSNSAESVQYPPRRPSRRGHPIGLTRQYPLRSSLRRNKEKQVNNGNNSNGKNNSHSKSCDSNNIIVAGKQSPQQYVNNSHKLSNKSSSNNNNNHCNRPPSVRNSIADCCSNISSNQQFLAMSSNILTSFPFNRVGSRTVSFENRQTLKLLFMDAGEVAVAATLTIGQVDNSITNMMDTGEEIHSKTLPTTSGQHEQQHCQQRQPQQFVATTAMQAAAAASTVTTTTAAATSTASLKPPRV